MLPQLKLQFLQHTNLYVPIKYNTYNNTSNNSEALEEQYMKTVNQLRMLHDLHPLLWTTSVA